MASDKESSQEADDGERIESLERGLRVLQTMGAARKPATLSEVAKAADLSRATARRILLTFQHLGFVVSDGRLFTLTPRVLSLASAYLSSNQVVTVLQPVLDEVAAETREVCSLAVLDGDDVVFVARASPARVFSAGIDIGYRLPAFCTSVGRALLARLPDVQLARVLASCPRAPQTEATVTDPVRLLDVIQSDRARGYSLVDQEAEPGFRSIAVPVRRYDGEIVAAINVGTHVDRVTTEAMIAQFLPALKRAAKTVQPLLL